MTPAPSTIILQHGTTLKRAQEIIARGPDPYYVEPGSGGVRWDAPGFSTRRTDRRVDAVGTSEEYALRKAAGFPNEGGAVILELEVSMDLVAVLEADPVSKFSMNSGDVCFDPEVGMTELLAAWPTIVKRVIVL